MGADGVGVTGVEVSPEGNLVLTLSNGQSLDAGSVVGPQGAPGRDGIAADLQCDEGALVQLSNGAWACSAHASDPNAHHPADGEGIDMRPRSVTVGNTQITDGEIDLSPEDGDEVTAPMLRTLLGGGQADALHTHAAQPAAGGGGGACYVAVGTEACGEGFSAMYTGIFVVTSEGTWGAVGPFCVEDSNLSFRQQTTYYDYLYNAGTGRQYNSNGPCLALSVVSKHARRRGRTRVQWPLVALVGSEVRFGAGDGATRFQLRCHRLFRFGALECP